MGNIIVIALVLAILGGAAWYIYRSKKGGQKCIGCPCGGKCDGQCGQ